MLTWGERMLKCRFMENYVHIIYNIIFPSASVRAEFNDYFPNYLNKLSIIMNLLCKRRSKAVVEVKRLVKTLQWHKPAIGPQRPIALVIAFAVTPSTRKCDKPGVDCRGAALITPPSPTPAIHPPMLLFFAYRRTGWGMLFALRISLAERYYVKPSRAKVSDSMPRGGILRIPSVHTVLLELI